jgi:hypothetical protein
MIYVGKHRDICNCSKKGIKSLVFRSLRGRMLPYEPAGNCMLIKNQSLEFCVLILSRNLNSVTSSQTRPWDLQGSRC